MPSYGATSFKDVVEVLGRENPSIRVRRCAATQVRVEPEAWQVLAGVDFGAYSTTMRKTAATLEAAFDALIDGIFLWVEHVTPED